MTRKRKGCKYCDSNRKDWEYKAIPVNMGDFGEYEVCFYVSKGRGHIGVDFGEKTHEPIFESRFMINYCPYCGSKLSEDTNAQNHN